MNLEFRNMISRVCLIKRCVLKHNIIQCTIMEKIGSMCNKAFAKKFKHKKIYFNSSTFKEYTSNFSESEKYSIATKMLYC